ncbi:uncharacterized protein SPPG_05626 [Spizellomyces punctatus DAOM BR117]|uniref:RGS domain-containing protein n=1 Tax=Spizellomyces punctatus (strain DAOM BR117) TaxID=645134 RepID=A0A0L0HE50_SPIPD|nr:uncharacterized protein SPPG_05626 [Spizellomyces punctatus DAOM BR117]KNC99382.1 hypothetical protein SPPG_05626 [Spizellomyces punctatus DAOM BR117]|eukprot:XP_016607422.1 hypothetical protein SPPG_05626 [Spizellomyces punctatus DAOM BR117]
MMALRRLLSHNGTHVGIHRRLEIGPPPDYSVVDFGLIERIYGTFLAVLAVWWLASLGLYIRRRHTPCIAEGGVYLTVVGAISGFLVCADMGLHVVLKRWPCSATMWTINLGVSTTILTIFFRGVLVFRKYNLCHWKASFFTTLFTDPIPRDRPPVSSASSISATSVATSTEGLVRPRTSLGQQDQQPAAVTSMRRRQTEASEPHLTSHLAVWVTLFAIWTIIAQVLTRQNRLWPAVDYSDTSNMRCALGWEYAPVTALLALYLFVGCPLASMKLRDVNDAYGIRTAVWTGIAAGIPGFLFYILWVFYVERKWPAVLVVFPDQLWTILAQVANHATAVFVPAVRSFTEENRRRSVTLCLNMESFQKVLNNPVLFAEFKQVAIADFNVDNALFYEEYTSLQDAVLAAYTNSPNTTAPATATPSPRSCSISETPNGIELEPISYNKPSDIAPWVEESRDPNFTLPSRPSTVAIFGPRRRSVADAWSKRKEPVIGSSSNSPSTTIQEPPSTICNHTSQVPRDWIVPPHLLARFQSFHDTFTSRNAPLEVNLPSSVADVIRQAFMKRGSIHVGIFDEAAKEVVWSMFGNTFPAYLKAREEGPKCTDPDRWWKRFWGWRPGRRRAGVDV